WMGFNPHSLGRAIGVLKSYRAHDNILIRRPANRPFVVSDSAEGHDINIESPLEPQPLHVFSLLEEPAGQKRFLQFRKFRPAFDADAEILIDLRRHIPKPRRNAGGN